MTLDLIYGDEEFVIYFHCTFAQMITKRSCNVVDYQHLYIVDIIRI